ncbi:MAG: YafY family transcriptional regulator [Cyclobacteriaceae bacterium]|nr:YafY family transcriptional regulator [Cyclobacteriaceae bacterium]
MNRIDRLTAILIQLQTKRVVKAEEIARRFEISLRTVYRDVKSLMEAGVPIGSEAGKGYFIVDGFHLPPVMFTQEEASAMLMAGKLVEKMTDRSVRNSFESALHKIKSVLKDSEKDHLESLEAYVQVFQFPHQQQESFPNHFLTDIQKALVQREVLSIEYFSNQNQLTTREVEPIGISYYSAGWHLIAWCRLRQDYRDFRADRIQSLANTGKTFDHRNLLTLQEYMKSLVESHYGLQKAVVIFDKAIFKYRRYVYGFIAEVDLGDKVQMTFLVDNLQSLGRWLLAYGSGVEVVEPDELKTILVELVDRLQQHYLSKSVV